MAVLSKIFRNYIDQYKSDIPCFVQEMYVPELQKLVNFFRYCLLFTIQLAGSINQYILPLNLHQYQIHGIGIW